MRDSDSFPACPTHSRIPIAARSAVSSGTGLTLRWVLLEPRKLDAIASMRAPADCDHRFQLIATKRSD